MRIDQSDVAADYCRECRRPVEACRCEAWNELPAPVAQPKNWTISYFSPALGRKVYGGAMTEKSARGWVATMKRGRKRFHAVALRVLPLVRCEQPRVSVFHDGPMRPASQLMEVK